MAIIEIICSILVAAAALVELYLMYRDRRRLTFA